MNIACLMPTWGRPSLVDNAITCFEAQTHPAGERRLLILDDAGQLANGGNGCQWGVWSTGKRFPSLTQKYQHLHRLLNDWWPEWDAIALMDDDDIYGPDWLASHSAVLKYHPWSYPRHIYSLYGVDLAKGELPIVEESGGRFWASCAIRRGHFEACGGFHDTREATFDQQHLRKWGSKPPGRPDDWRIQFPPRQYGPHYVYGWGRTVHVSGFMGKPDWYERHRKAEERSGVVTPRMDATTRLLYRRLWGVETAIGDSG